MDVSSVRLRPEHGTPGDRRLLYRNWGGVALLHSGDDLRKRQPERCRSLMSRRVDTPDRVDRPVMRHLARTVVLTSPDRVTHRRPDGSWKILPPIGANIFHDPVVRVFRVHVVA